MNKILLSLIISVLLIANYLDNMLKSSNLQIKISALEEKVTQLTIQQELLHSSILQVVKVTEIIQIIRRAKPNLSNQLVKQIASSVSEASQKYSVDPLIILAVIRQESNFNPTIVGRVGEIGLMQIMPGWKVMLGITDLSDIRINILTGTLILRNHLDRLSSVSLALEAYNRGHKRAASTNLSYSMQVLDKVSELRK